jgi:TRAP-type C4-dicarboxylate transport system permease small subunit
MGRFISAVADKLNFVSGFVIIIMMLAMSIDVVFRYLLKMAVLDTMEISSLLLGVTVSLALPFVTDKEEHVRFDLLTDRLSPRGRSGARFITLLISVPLFILLTWQTTRRAISSFKSGEFIGTMETPLWPGKFLFAFGCLLTLLVLLAQFLACFVSKPPECPVPEHKDEIFANI